MDKRKVQKTLRKRCPDCYGRLEIIAHIQEKNGISFSIAYEECLECGYQKKLDNKHNHNEKLDLV